MTAVVAVMAADLAGAWWAGRQGAGTPLLFGAARVAHVLNPGVSMGLAAGHPVLVLAGEVAGTAAVLAWLVRARSGAERLALAIVVGGAAGNLTDRLLHGAVTDWIQLTWYDPVFNLADVAIRGGLLAALLVHLVGRASRR